MNITPKESRDFITYLWLCMWVIIVAFCVGGCATTRCDEINALRLSPLQPLTEVACEAANEYEIKTFKLGEWTFIANSEYLIKKYCRYERACILMDAKIILYREYDFFALGHEFTHITNGDFHRRP